MKGGIAYGIQNRIRPIGSVCTCGSVKRRYLRLRSDPVHEAGAGHFRVHSVSGAPQAAKGRIPADLRPALAGAKPAVLPCDGQGQRKV